MTKEMTKKFTAVNNVAYYQSFSLGKNAKLIYAIFDISNFNEADFHMRLFKGKYTSAPDPYHFLAYISNIDFGTNTHIIHNYQIDLHEVVIEDGEVTVNCWQSSGANKDVIVTIWYENL